MSLPPIEARADERTGRSAAFDGLVEDIRRLYGFNPDLLQNLEDVVRRRLGVPPIYWGITFNWAFTAREARYDHELFWPSPADAPEVRTAMRKTIVRRLRQPCRRPQDRRADP